MGLRVLMCTSEAVPFAKTGGLADVAGALPPALAKLGHDVRLALPKYGEMDPKIPSKAVGGQLQVPVGGKAVAVGIEQSDALKGVPTYLVDCPGYFDRKGLYGHPDDAERFGCFCLAVLEFLRQGDWKPDVIHCNDWQTALIPVQLKTRYAQDRKLAGIGTLLTIHNLAYQGVFDRAAMAGAGVAPSLWSVEGVEFYGQVNFLKGGLLFADMLNTVSKRYAEEIQTAEYGERLEGVLARRKAELFGILNGIDCAEWDPATDRFIAANFGPGKMGPKGENKAALQQRYKLAKRPEVPLFGLVSRLAGQKGLDLLAEVLPQFLRLDVQFVLLGTGEQQYHELLSRLAKEFPSKMGVALSFDNALAHLIYAGSDMFLMPSRYEPCGLGQMISLRYGTVPVVRTTGGLADTISEFDPATGKGNGFCFDDYTAVALMGAMVRSVEAYRAGEPWRKLVQNTMACDFSWDRSAGEYERLYQRAVDAGRGS
ncbi:MAG: glycogen synthase GlgA [Armatimonadota bacterium]